MRGFGCLLREAINHIHIEAGHKIIISVLYLSPILRIISCSQCLSDSLSVDKEIVTIASDFHNHARWRKYMLSKLSWMHHSKYPCIWNNWLPCFIYTVLDFQHGNYHQVFLITNKYLKISCAASIVCFVFQLLLYFLDSNVLFPMTVVAPYTILTGNQKRYQFDLERISERDKQ